MMYPCVNQISLQIKSICKLFFRPFVSRAMQREVEESYKLLKIPPNSKQETVREAFLQLAKKYHPDSKSPDADIEKFIAIENAFRVLCKHNTGSTDEVDKIVFDIRHTAPQHRQYLSYEGVGHGTPYQREKQWKMARAQKAVDSIMQHKVVKAVVSDKALMKKESLTKLSQKKVETKYGFDKIVENIIQESISKGEFENLSGKGKPLKDQNRNPYVDFTTHKLNQVLINNGFAPEWIRMNKEINKDIEHLKDEIRSERKYLGPFPLSDSDNEKWNRIYETNKDLAKSINSKINKYNLIVPLLNKQKFYVEYDKICNDILIHGEYCFENTVEKNEKNSLFDRIKILLL